MVTNDVKQLPLLERQVQRDPSGGLHEVLADVTNKMLRRGYDEAPRTLPDWQGTAPDFRPQHEPILDGVSDIQEATGNGKYAEGIVKEGTESWLVTRRGLLIRITPKMIANSPMRSAPNAVDFILTTPTPGLANKLSVSGAR